jgi:hypothetical protein
MQRVQMVVGDVASAVVATAATDSDGAIPGSDGAIRRRPPKKRPAMTKTTKKKPCLKVRRTLRS